MELYNKISAEERRLLIEAENTERLTLSFYKYNKIFNPKLFRDYLFLHWNSMGVLGRIYIAHEGINAQLSLPAFKFKKFRTFLDEITFLKGVRLNIAVEQNDESFLKLTIKIKDKIVIIDDIFATSGTMKASINLIKRSKASIKGIIVLLELSFLNGRSKINEKLISLEKVNN